MTRSLHAWLLWSLALAGLTVDLATKFAVFRWLEDRGSFEVVPGAFRLIAQFTAEPVPPGWFESLQRLNGETLPRVNRGALFGLGGVFEQYANSFFALVSIVAAVAIIGWSMRNRSRDWGLTAALGLILAGTLGNLFDRVVFGGVRDFLYFYWIEWPVFNVADCCLVVGAGILLLQAAWPANAKPRPAVESERPAEVGSGTG